MTPQEKKQVIKNHFSSLGKKGGAATTKKMTKKQLHERAVKGGIARHAKKIPVEKSGDVSDIILLNGYIKPDLT